MGRNLARNLAHHGHKVALHNRTYARTKSLVDEHGSEGTFVPSETIEDFVASLARPRAIIIMVKAGDPTDAVVDELVPLLEPGDIVIDCGNAHFTDTRRREAALKEQQLHFVGAGVSGGEEGALNGPSIMPGGSQEAYRKLGPDLRVDRGAGRRRRRAARTSAPTAPGHFVKMVHNGIEYADMQLIAEAYDLLRQRLGASRAGDREDLPGVERGRPGVLPHRDHREGARACRRRHRQGVRRHRARPGRAEGHRTLDGAERARPRGARSPASPKRRSPGALSGARRSSEAPPRECCRQAKPRRR